MMRVTVEDLCWIDFDFLRYGSFEPGLADWRDYQIGDGLSAFFLLMICIFYRMYFLATDW